MRKLIPFLFVLLLSTPVNAHISLEKSYQDKWCKDHQGVTEVVLDDKTRIDCVTEGYSIEFDFAGKVYEGVGQALWYALKTGLQPGLVLISEDSDKDEKYIKRAKLLCEKHNIKLWIIRRDEQ